MPKPWLGTSFPRLGTQHRFSEYKRGLLVAVLIVSWGIMDRNMNQASNTKVLPQMALHWSKPNR